MNFDIPDPNRRTVLGGLAVLGALSVLLVYARVDDELAGERGTEGQHADSHHPGHPRFVEVGEWLHNPVHVGEHGILHARDNLSPRLPEFDADPENYDASAFEWSIIDRPDGSNVALTHGASAEPSAPRYDRGAANVAEFEADVPGRYVVGLDAPDGSHELTIHAFPEGGGPRPRLELDATFDEAEDEFVVEADAELAPSAKGSPSDAEVVFLADDRDALDHEDLRVDGHEVSLDDHEARVPVEALDGDAARVHAACHDGNARSAMDTVELDSGGDVHLPNRPPEWAREGVMYQIFPRSWAGERGETTMADLIEGVEYLDDLGVDWVWLTPVVPAESSNRQYDGDLLADEYAHMADGLAGGGPHGYDTLDYFGIAPDLVPDGEDPIESYRRFVEACNDRGIRVVFDLVANHSGRSHPLFQETIDEQALSASSGEFPPVEAWEEDAPQFDWFDRVDGAAVSAGGDVFEPRPHVTGFFGLPHMPNFNYDTLATRAFMLAVADFWSGEVGVDGFRCDVAWGVPMSLWSEIRDVVRANDSEFLMLDETIPKDPRMGENAFDMHFDTEGFTTTAHEVARGDADPSALAEAVERRLDEGIPNHSLVLNLIENHDERRLLNQAVVDPADPDHESVSDEEWERGARLQRLCWAAGVCLPGVPGIYYGQERQISRYGEGRHDGPVDDRGRDGDGVDPEADVRPGGRQRAFMNWDEYPDEHLGFYRALVDSYHELDALEPGADLVETLHDAPDDVLAFGREADGEDGDGPRRVAVLLNFGAEPATVAVREPVSEVDLVSGDPIDDSDPDREGTVVRVDELAVLPADGQFSASDAE